MSDRHRAPSSPGDDAIELSPSGVVVETTRPRFRWSAVEGAQYVVLLSHRGDVVAESEPLTANSWTPEQPLVRGRTYEWHLEIRTGANVRVVPAAPQSPARFEVLSSDARREIERARDTRPGDHLLAGILYARAGARDAAERELRAAAAAGDGDAAKLLESLRAWPSGRVTLR